MPQENTLTPYLIVLDLDTDIKTCVKSGMAYLLEKMSLKENTHS
jgi:hypothetical protein